ncbi:DNRLRE domain-containing protein [Paenibacillus sp. IB182496]|uniref:DNRLRE domain-containing protein n=1 Tax=Paenibacillus sabuli TaxID=2772509 RepID=A0A927BU26_9BACL|nr:DNRLRE domain-containing protein [Paenibacillus sabuli]MBD2846322.1 DNRLRE domain-containing protein [Paenibacillus sabuli]
MNCMQITMRRAAYALVGALLVALLAPLQAVRAEDAETELPQAGEIIAALKAAHPGKAHPRLMATEADFDRIRSHKASDPVISQMYQQVKSAAQATLQEALPVYEMPDGLRLPASGQVLAAVRELAMMYRVDEDPAYAARAWDILQTAGNFPDWNPGHYLDLATMTQAFAIGFDWLYDVWTDEQKVFLREAIASKGLEPTLAVYRGEAPGSWKDLSHNWNTVVNGGIGIGALAIADETAELEQLAGEALASGLQSIQRVLPRFVPDGGGREGVAYWSYNASHFVYYAASLRSALHTDYGLTDAPGISGTAYYPIYMGGPGGSFNYSDSGTALVSNAIFFWFAERYDDPDLANHHLKYLEEHAASELDLLWYDPDHVRAPVELGLDRVFRGIDAGSMRSAWDDPYAVFAGFKGGNNRFNHGNLDLGTFVLDALGVRWANDLGTDNYNLPGYFNTSGPRWEYYRLRTEGQNTLVLNPSNGPGQALDGVAEMIGYAAADDEAFMIADLSAGYSEAEQALRGVALLDHRRQILIQDELKLKSPGDVHWFMHTTADIAIEDGGRTAVLRDGDKKLVARILTEGAGVAFRIRDSAPMPLSPNPQGQAENTFSKLEVYGKVSEELQLAILMVPLMEWEAQPQQWPAIEALAEWEAPEADIAKLGSLTIDGQSAPGFRADKFTYYMEAASPNAVPVVLAEAAESGDEVEISYPEHAPGIVSVTITPSDSSRRAAEYRIYLNPPYAEDETVMASGDDGNVPQNTLDDNLNTRWSASGAGQWIQYKLPELQTLDQVDIAFYNGHTRATSIDILVSEDGAAWEQVYSGQSSGVTSDYESFAFEATPARYVRIVGNGNTSNSWNSISEVTIAGLPKEPPGNQLGLAELTMDTGVDYLAVDDTLELELEGTMKNGAPVDWSEVELRYISSKPEVATVDSEGVVRGISHGKAQLIAEAVLNGNVKTAVTELEVTDGLTYVRPSADAYVQGGTSADTNFGSSQRLVVKHDNNLSYSRESYLQFQLPELEEPIVAASLYLNAAVEGDTPAQTNLSVVRVAEDWDEAAITWNVRPETGSLLAAREITNTRQWYELDLTEYVQEQAQSGANLNLALKQELGSRGTYIWSREAEDAPYLKITTLSMAVPVTGITVSAELGETVVATGQSVQMRAEAEPAEASNRNVSWRVDNGSGEAEIDASSGLLTGIRPGSVTVYAEAVDGSGVTGSLEMQVGPRAYRLEPMADAYVRGGSYADQNYGAGTSLLMKQETSESFTRESFMTFDLSSVAGPVESASLRLYGTVADTAGDTAMLGVYEASGAWEESGLTWNTRPTVGNLLQTEQMDSVAGWHELDLTAYIRQQQEAGAAVNLALLQQRNNKGLLISVHSRQGENKPYLHIVEATEEEAPAVPGDSGNAGFPDNLLSGGGFETVSPSGMPEGWGLWTAQGTPQASVDEDVYDEGARSLRLHADVETRAAAGQYVGGIVENQTYQLRVRVKTEQLQSAGRGATVRVQFLDDSGTNTGDHAMIGSWKGDQDWTLGVETVTAPPGTTRMHVQLFIWQATGTVWFDEVVLKEQNTTIPWTDPLFAVPSGQTIVDQLISSHPNRQHPRIMATADDFAAMRSRAGGDPLVEQWYLRLKQQVQDEMLQPLPTYDIPDGYRLLATSRRVLRDIQRLGILYQIERDDIYLDRAWDILEAAGNFPDWNPQHFLDVAEMTNAFALGYDWFYDGWSAAQRTFLVEAIRDMGLVPAAQVYRGEVDGAFGRSGWLMTNNNWNTVVNGGMAMGALAIADESAALGELAADVLEGGLHSIQRLLPMFAPDGAGEEGVGYWAYNVNYLVYYAATLDTALGTDYGVTAQPGVAETAYFPIFMGGPRGAFNYGDNAVNHTQTPSFFWLADRFDDPDVAWYQRHQVGAGGGALDLLWYDPANVSEAVNFPLDKDFVKVDSGSMRSAWDDEYASFVGFKGGNNAWNHNQLDLGTFVYDALGVRWAADLGGDNYNLPGYFGEGKSIYYRSRTEGQNTLVLSPGYAPSQRPGATADIVRRASAPDEAFMIADLSDGYAEQAEQVRRGVALRNHRRELLVQDEIAMKAPGDLYWFMHTTADIEVAGDGRSAMLSSGDRRLYAEIVSPSGLRFDVREAAPLPTSPDPQGQAVNALNKLTVLAEGTEDLQLAIRFVPLLSWENAPQSAPPTVDLDDWELAAAPRPLLDGITLDGQPLDGFRADTFTYHVPLEDGMTAVPAVGAMAADASCDVTVIPADGVPGTTAIRVQDCGGTAAYAEYRVHFVGEPVASSVVTASSDDGNKPENTVDGNLSTRWSASGAGEWIQYALDQERTIDHVDIAFHSGASRSTIFDIAVSADGDDWSTVYSGQSSGQTLELERFDFAPTPTRYVRIIGYGNTSNAWNSLTEVEIEGLPELTTPLRLDTVSVTSAVYSLKLGETAQLQWEAHRTDGTLLDPQQAQVRYVSGTPELADLSPQGVVTGLEVGMARLAVEVTWDGYTRVGIIELEIQDEAVRVQPIADAYVRGGSYADVNYGNGNLTVKDDGSPGFTREGLMRFALPELEGEVESATLYLYAGVHDTRGSEGTLSIYSTSGAWDEGTVTWNTKPALVGELDTAAVGEQQAWVAFDLTAYIAGQLAAAEPAELAIIQSMNGQGLATSVTGRQSAQFAPYLRIVESATEAPALAAALTPAEPDGEGGWYVAAPVLTLAGAEGAEGVYRLTAAQAVYGTLPSTDGYVPYTGPVTLAEGIYEIAYRAAGAGDETAQTMQVKVDASAPVLALEALEAQTSEGTIVYTIDQTVRIACAASDALSGLTPESCTGLALEADAYTLEAGPQTVSAAARDVAGHRIETELSIAVYPTFAGLGALTTRFAGETEASGGAAWAEQASGLLAAGETAAAAGDGAAARAQLQAYMAAVEEASGQELDAAQAAALGMWGERLLEATPLAAGAPGTPVLWDDNGHDTGLADGDYRITMNLWWGDNGTTYRLYENGELLEERALTDATPAAQTVETEVSGRANGTYTYTCELVNSHGTTPCAPHTVTVTDAAPGKPTLASDNWDGDGSYAITMNLWWGTNGTAYRLYENDELVDTQALEAGTPAAQTAVTALSGRPPGTYAYVAELSGPGGTTQSDALVVAVSGE